MKFRDEFGNLPDARSNSIFPSRVGNFADEYHEKWHSPLHKSPTPRKNTEKVRIHITSGEWLPILQRMGYNLLIGPFLIPRQISFL
jgi:hypothetical protein